MRTFRITTLPIALVAAALLLTAAAPAFAQADGPRTPNGKPDFSGTYDAATLTPLVRPQEYGDNLFLTPEEAEKIAKREKALLTARNAASDPDREAPPDGGDGSEGAAGNVGGYNTFWIDRGSDAFLVDGKFRTSILTDPPNGRFPQMTESAIQARRERGRTRRPNDGTAYWIDQGDEPGPFDNMEQRPMAERCLLGFTGNVPTFPSLYNNYKRIVQTDTHVMIEIEMVHDARIVRIDSEHAPDHEKRWLGDSIGWWEGETLVVQTKNFHPLAQMRGGSAAATITEKFSRESDGNVLYAFTVDDPTTWVAPWSGEYIWKATDGKVFEYACHEGNYSFQGIMAGARVLERDVIEAKESDR